MKQEYQQIQAPKPFVKWAGGKRQLIEELSKNFPKEYGTYFEPFLGGGAVFFHILTKNPQQGCNISDLNSELIDSYTIISQRVDDLILLLQKHAKNYSKNSKKYYYDVRQNVPQNRLERTARLIFLNRTCFNGLYRVNNKGMFNVPLGRYTNPNIVNEQNLRAVSEVLNSKKISINCRDFDSILPEAKQNDFIYFDPPYQPVSNTSNFTSYTSKDFTYADLERLVRLCSALDKKGCKVLFSNSYSEKVMNLFSRKTWKIVKISANRAINSNSKKRMGHSELLIKNY